MIKLYIVRCRGPAALNARAQSSTVTPSIGMPSPLFFSAACLCLCLCLRLSTAARIGGTLGPVGSPAPSKGSRLRRRVLYIRSGFWTPAAPQPLEDATPAKAAMHIAAHMIAHVPSGGATAATGSLATVDTTLSVSKRVLGLLGGMPLSYVKVSLQLLLTLLNIGFWIVPLRNKKFTKNDSLLSTANCFAGGIFIMLGFGHLLPHSIETLQSIGVGVSQAFYFALGGYLAIFVVEKILFDSHAMMHSVGSSSDSSGSNDSAHTDSHLHDSHQSHLHDSHQSHLHDSDLHDSHLHDSHLHDSHLHDSHQSHLHDSHHGGGHVEPPKEQIPQFKAAPAATVTATVQSTRSAIILLLAMSIHSLVETMALGIARDKTSATFMAASVALHQPAESLALLVAFLKSGMPTASIVKWLGLFSLVGPLGVCLGIYLSRVATPLVDAAVVAATAGTFMYVGMTEVVGEEFEEVDGREKYVRFLALLGGVATIAVVTRYSEAFEHAH